MDKFNQFSHAKLYFVSHCNDTVHCWLFTVISFIKQKDKASIISSYWPLTRSEQHVKNSLKEQ